MSALVHRVNHAIRRCPAWPVYLAGALPPVWYVWLGLTGGLGPEPIGALERRLGELALQALIVTLLVTPVRRATGVNLTGFRRALGLLAFYYVCCHFLAWAVLDIGDPGRIWADIVKRPYITIGMIAGVLLVPLALTSNARSIRALGPVRWRRLHMLGYAACALGAVHYVMVTKGWQLEPLIYLAAILAILATRLPAVRRLAPV